MIPLPPLGTVTEDNESLVVSYLTRLAKEATDGAAEWVGLPSINRSVYAWGTYPAPDATTLNKRVVNSIQNAVISGTNEQTKDPRRVKLAPVETGDQPQYYWAGPDYVGQLLGIAPQSLSHWYNPDDQPDPMNPSFISPPLPLEPEQGEELADAAADAMPLPIQSITGQLLQLREDWVVAVNDETTCETVQSVFDLYWTFGTIDRRNRSNQMQTNIDGWSFWLYEWDQNQKAHVLRPMSPIQCYIDPTVEDIADAAYFGVDWVLDAEEARKLYPTLRDFIDTSAADGYPGRPDQNTEIGAAFDRAFQRDTVTLRIFWLRNAPIPLSPQEAVAGGTVEARPEPTNSIDIDTSSTGSQQDGQEAQDSGDPLASLPEQNTPENMPSTSPLPDLDQSDDDANAIPGPQSPEVTDNETSSPQPSLKYFKPGTDQEIAPTDEQGNAHPDWPCRRGIRQIITVARTMSYRVAADEECPHWDIPVIHNVNIPIPNSPFGMGEPFRLWALQEGNSDVIRSMIDYCRQFAAPLETLPESVADLLKDEYGSAYARPGNAIVVPDEMWKASNGNISAIIPPPPMPPGLLQLQPILDNLISEQSGHQPVQQGVADPGDSGKKVELLQDAASSVTGFKAQRTDDAIYRQGMLMLRALLDNLTIQDVARIVKKYPPHILQAIWSRAQTGMLWDINVVSSSGSSVSQSAKRNRAAGDLQLGAIDMETYREQAGIDHKTVERRQMAQQRKQMAAAAQAQPAMPPPQPANKPAQPNRGASNAGR